MTSTSISIAEAPNTPDQALALEVVGGDEVLARLPHWRTELASAAHPAHDLRWLAVLQRGLGHIPYVIESRAEDRLAGLLPLALVKSHWFGRFLVSLPYINSAGALPAGTMAESALASEAVNLADRLGVRYLELRHEHELSHLAFRAKNTAKVHMRLALPATAEALLAGFKSKLRSQVKGSLKPEIEVCWGGRDLLPDFYGVFCHNMRDLGMPVFPRGLFEAILEEFAGQAEFCVVRLAGKAAAGALLVHGHGTTEVPSASSLRSLSSSGVNMAMYWHLLVRAIERGQKSFDFGRSTEGSGTYKFKEQWGAKPSPAIWQYYLRKGSVQAMRPDNGKFGLAIRVWKRLPLWLANAMGPHIVRGIP